MRMAVATEPLYFDSEHKEHAHIQVSKQELNINLHKTISHSPDCNMWAVQEWPCSHKICVTGKLYSLSNCDVKIPGYFIHFYRTMYATTVFLACSVVLPIDHHVMMAQ